MDNSVVVQAPAKINLSLDITGKRDDGYHFMRMVLQTVDLFDYVTVSLTDGYDIEIDCNQEDVAKDKTNIVYKAAIEFFDYSGKNPCGIKIQIDKNIPLNAGLAGGSTDAAAVLVALNELCKTGYDNKELCYIGIKVGADVPFCIVGGTVMAEGIGEIFTHLPDLEECYIVIAKPTGGVLTSEAFAKFDETIINNKVPDFNKLVAAIASQSLSEMADEVINVMEMIVDDPIVEQLKKAMISDGAIAAAMTGSGTAVFAIFESKSKAKKCLRHMEEFVDVTFLTRPVNSGAVIID